MDRNRSGGTSKWAAALVFPLLVLGCDAADPEVERPPDLPTPALEALGSPGAVDLQLIPRTHDLNGIAMAHLGDFVVTAEMETDEVSSQLMFLPWSEEEGRWAQPRELPFSAPGTGDGAPALAPDASYLLFHSGRPTTQPAAATYNIWVAQREDGPDGEVGWTDPWLLPGVFSPAWDGTPALAGDGSLFFASEREGPMNLYVAPFETGTWMAPQKLPEPVNSSVDDADPFIAPDQSFIVYASNRDGLFDLYVVFADGEGWGEPVRLNENVNSPDAHDRSPYLSSGGSTLFWIRDGELMAAPADETGLRDAQQESEMAGAEYEG